MRRISVFATVLVVLCGCTIRFEIDLLGKLRKKIDSESRPTSATTLEADEPRITDPLARQMWEELKRTRQSKKP